MVGSVYFWLFLSLLSITEAGRLEDSYKKGDKEFKSAISKMNVYEIGNETMEEIPWKCGPNIPIINYLSKKMAEARCPRLAQNMAKYACAKHDNCYNCGRGQVHCDHKFCAILETGLNLSNAKGSCIWLFRFACSSVKKTGYFFYEGSNPNDCIEGMGDEMAI